MFYISTRGGATPVMFEETLLAGLAQDCGLYMPAEWPFVNVAASLDAGRFYDTASAILEPFVAPWIDAKTLRSLAVRAYESFETPDIAPLVQVDEEDWLLELFHGPTLAFKDIAMQLLGCLFDVALAETGRRIAIIGATSGDTGAAAIEAFRGKSNVDIFILHPKGRVTEIQRRMMTTVTDRNVHNIAVNGAFDDCQRIVKSLFGDTSLSETAGLAGVNSINWARLAVQTVYYFTGLAALKEKTDASVASFSVPTGNFGDAFAGFAASLMGAPIAKICVAVNQNDILHRALTTGRYKPQMTMATSSPSMDIQVASNFERLLFESSGRDSASVASLMHELDQRGEFEIPAAWLKSMRSTFISERISEDETRRTMTDVLSRSGILIDPHTAVGLAAARKARKNGRVSGPVITLATAHPAKFPDAVSAATGRTPMLPDRLRGIYDLPETFQEAPAEISAVRRLLTDALRAA